jgi:hypothetical protein
MKNLNANLQEWANSLTFNEVTIKSIITKVKESAPQYNYMEDLAACQIENPSYKIDNDVVAVESFNIDNGEGYIEHYTVKILGVWLGDGSGIDFHLIDVKNT